jgi:hypothetical protein
MAQVPDGAAISALAERRKRGQMIGWATLQLGQWPL